MLRDSLTDLPSSTTLPQHDKGSIYCPFASHHLEVILFPIFRPLASSTVSQCKILICLKAFTVSTGFQLKRALRPPMSCHHMKLNCHSCGLCLWADGQRNFPFTTTTLPRGIQKPPTTTLLPIPPGSTSPHCPFLTAKAEIYCIHKKIVFACLF